MSEAQTTTETATNDGAKKAPATFHAILGEKVGMTQIYHPKDQLLYDVTVVKAGPCPILRVKTADSKDGYNAVQLGFGSRRDKTVTKAQVGQFKKAGVPTQRYVREIRVDDTKGLEAGQVVAADVAFKPGDYVDVQGVIKGRGFAGVMKRHGFRGLPASHGASDKQRSPGSLASRRALGRVMPGQRMAGHYGDVPLTTVKLEVVKIDPEQNLMYIAGAVPGARGGLVTIHQTYMTKKARVEVKVQTVKKDKMGNIIKPGAKPGKK